MSPTRMLTRDEFYALVLAAAVSGRGFPEIPQHLRGYDWVGLYHRNYVNAPHISAPQAMYGHWVPSDWEEEKDPSPSKESHYCNCYVPKPINLSLFRPYYVCDSCNLEIKEKKDAPNL